MFSHELFSRFRHEHFILWHLYPAFGHLAIAYFHAGLLALHVRSACIFIRSSIQKIPHFGLAFSDPEILDVGIFRNCICGGNFASISRIFSYFYCVGILQ